jgi:hypothetical protein
MKNLLVSLIICGLVVLIACNKEDKSERFKLLTDPVWVTDSLLADGVDASEPGMLLAKFKGDAKFNEDGTGTFGVYKGTWHFAYNETQIVIFSDSLLIPLVTLIKELTNTSLKITTSVPNLSNLSDTVNIRMTFKAK